MTCRHEVIALPPVSDWSDPPIWLCEACKAPIRDCDHAHQEPTRSGWECITCRRTLLAPPPIPRKAW
jgi:hypothetical protein